MLGKGMKTIAKLTILCLSMTLMSCASTGGETATTSAGNIAMGLFKSAVDTKCRSELNDNTAYQMLSVFMTGEQKQSLEDGVCGCVSEKAPEHVTLTELGQAAIDPTARTRIVGAVVVKTLNACVSEFLQK